MKYRLACAFVCWGLVAVPGANAGCWAGIDPVAFARRCPVIVRGTIVRVEPGQPMGGERVYDTAVIAIDKVFRNALGDEPTVKDGGAVRVLMVSTRNKFTVSTDLRYRIGTAGIWLIDLRPDARLHIDLRPEQRQPVEEEDRLRRRGAFQADLERVVRKGTAPAARPTKAELLARRQERERRERERARAYEAAQRQVRDLASSLAAARLGDEQLRRFDREPEHVRRDLFNLRLEEVKLTGPNRVALCAHVLRREPVDNIRAAAAAWLDGSDAPQAALLRQALQDRSEFVRSTGCGRLASCPERGTAALLARLLDDKSWWVRMAAVDAVGRLGDKAQAPAVLALCAKEGCSEENAYHFAEALARLGEADASLRCVRTCLASDNENIRHFGVLALGQNRSAKVVPAALELLAPELGRTVAELKRGRDLDRVFVGLCAELRRRTGQKIGNDVLAWHTWWATANPGRQGQELRIDRTAVRALQDEYRKLRP
jgi:hypothetical protein